MNGNLDLTLKPGKLTNVMVNMMKNMAEDIMTYSKDPNTKVGAVVMDEYGRVYSGCNKASKNIELGDLWNKREGSYFCTKYPWIVHAEVSALIGFVKKYNHTPQDGVLFVTLFPCHECAKIISEFGIKSIVYIDDKYEGTPSNIIARRILKESGVEIHRYSDIVNK